MGTDIHVICQVKENGVWINNPKIIFPDMSYKLFKQYVAEAITEGNNEDLARYTKLLSEQSEYTTDPYESRNYDWFAVLANVRNGYGFAGVQTGDGFNFITSKRGFPKGFKKPKDTDCYDEAGNRLGTKWLGDHSFGWASVDEIANFNWNQFSEKTGVISFDVYKKLRGTNETPETWSGSIGGGDNITLSESEANDIIDGKTTSPFGSKNVQYKWKVYYKDWFERELKNWLEPMLELKKEYEDVRVVFGFDS